MILLTVKKSILCVIFLIFVSCSQWDDENLSNSANYVNCSDGECDVLIECRHEAILTYLVFTNRHVQTEICWGPSIIPDRYHVQTRALIDGEWKWLKMYGDRVYTSIQDPFTPTVFGVPLKEALAWSNIYPCQSTSE